MFKEADLKKIIVVLLLLMGGVGIGSYIVYEYSLQQKLALAEAKTELLRNQTRLNQQGTETPVIVQSLAAVPAENSAMVQQPAVTTGSQVTNMGHSVITADRSDLLSVDRAKEIAAAAIGVSVDKLAVYEIELNHKSGKIKYKHGVRYNDNPRYQMKCGANSLLYKIEIDAVDGRVIEVEIDD